MSVIEIKVDEDEIKNGILNEILSHLAPKFKIAVSKILQPVQAVIRDEIQNSNEYRQMTPGTRFYHELGIPDIEDRLNKIIDTIIDSIEVTVIEPRISGYSIEAFYSIKILNKDFSDILSIPEATFRYYSQRLKSDNQLNWLSWMLLEGSSTIVMDYHFAPVNKPQSRTGFGLMFKHGNWSVQPVISGTINDNFLTRAMNRIAYVIIKIVEKEFLILDT